MKKIFSFFILVSVLSSCGSSETVLKKYYSTRTAEKTDIDITQNYVWFVESDIVTNLSSEVPGEILAMNVHEWQSITQGENLLDINVDSSSLAAIGAQSMVSSLLSMKQSIAKSFDTQAEVLESQIKQAEIELASGKTNLDDTLSIQEKQNIATESSVELARQNLEAAKIEKEESLNILQTNKENLYTNAKNALTAIMIIDTNTASYIDEVFEVTDENKDKNDKYEYYLGAQDTLFYKSTKNAATTIYNDFKAFETLYNSTIKDKNPTEKEIDIALKEALSFNNTLKSFLSDMYQVFEKSSASEPYFSQEIIQGFKTKTSNFGSQIESTLLSASGNTFLGIQGIIQNLENLKNETQKTEALLSKKITLAETSLSSAEKNAAITSPTQKSQIHQNETNIALVNQKIEQLKINLKNLEATKKARLNELEVQITSSQVEKSLQWLAAGKGNITSPISGVVTKKYVEVGNVVGVGQALLQISDESSKKVTIDVSQEVLANISVGHTVKILFEGQETFIDGEISFIYPFQDEKTRKTRIEIRSKELNIIPLGTRGKIYLTTQSSHGVTIPKKAIISNFWVPGVYTIFNSEVVFTHIEIIEENEEIALVSGIDEGTKIIVLGKENIFDGESLENYEELPE